MAGLWRGVRGERCPFCRDLIRRVAEGSRLFTAPQLFTGRLELRRAAPARLAKDAAPRWPTSPLHGLHGLFRPAGHARGGRSLPSAAVRGVGAARGMTRARCSSTPTSPAGAGLVDDAAVWARGARRRARGARPTAARRRPTTPRASRHERHRRGVGGRRARAGGDVAYWAEQEAGAVRSCVLVDGRASATRRRCSTASTARSTSRSTSTAATCTSSSTATASTPARRAASSPRARISRAALAASADGESALVDVVTDGLNCPVFLAVDALWGADGCASGGGLLFSSDPGREAVVRANLDGSAAATVLSLAHPSGIAVDLARAALYVTQQVRGASLIWSDYAGDWQRHVTRNRSHAARPRRRPHRRRGGRRRDGLIRSDVQPGARHRRRRRRRRRARASTSAASRGSRARGPRSSRCPERSRSPARLRRRTSAAATPAATRTAASTRSAARSTARLRRRRRRRRRPSSPERRGHRRRRRRRGRRRRRRRGRR